MAIEPPSAAKLLSELKELISSMNRSYSWRLNGGYVDHPEGIGQLAAFIKDLMWWHSGMKYPRGGVWEMAKKLDVIYPNLRLVDAIEGMFDRALKGVHFPTSKEAEVSLPKSEFYQKIKPLIREEKLRPEFLEYVNAVEKRLDELDRAIELKNWDSSENARYSQLIDLAISLENIEFNKKMAPFLWRVKRGRKDKRALVLDKVELWEVIRKRAARNYSQKWRDKKAEEAKSPKPTTDASWNPENDIPSEIISYYE